MQDKREKLSRNKGQMDIICRQHTKVIRRTFTTKRFPSTARKESGKRTG